MPAEQHNKMRETPPALDQKLVTAQALAGAEDGNASCQSLTPAPATSSSTRPAEPTLQGIPPELRNKIYEHVNATDDSRKRTVLGWKLVKAHANAKKNGSTLREQMESSTTANPLSLTCRLLYNEYSTFVPTIAAPAYNLIVNNFDFEQIELFLEAIDEYIGIKNAFIRFQIDCNIVQSANALLDELEARRIGPLRCLERDYPSRFNLLEFSVLRRYRNASKSVDSDKTATPEQMQEAGQVIAMVKPHIDVGQPVLKEWLLRFLKVSNLVELCTSLQRAPSIRPQAEQFFRRCQ